MENENPQGISIIPRVARVAWTKSHHPIHRTQVWLPNSNERNNHFVWQSCTTCGLPNVTGIAGLNCFSASTGWKRTAKIFDYAKPCFHDVPFLASKCVSKLGKQRTCSVSRNGPLQRTEAMGAALKNESTSKVQIPGTFPT